MRSKPFIIGFFAVVAVLAAASFYLSRTVDRSDKAVAAFSAPDQKYKAIKMTLSGGGKLPFCIDSISVILGVYPDSFAERDKAYLVYSAPCEDNRELPKVEWLSNTDLQITYSAVQDAKQPRLKDVDVTKTVHVKFVAR